MKIIGNFLKIIIDIMDQHEGMVAMLGIAVTVLIFIREVSNNYFTMERDNFNDIFKELAFKLIPEKIDGVEQASEDEWSAKFAELMNVLDRILINAKYYKYSIPFFYECISLRINEIRDLERHDNWRLYRNAVKQNALIQKKCRSIIKNINNASKGRVLSIKLYQNKVIQKIRVFFAKNWSYHPADRITEIYMESSLDSFIFEQAGESTVDISALKKLYLGELCIKPRDSSIHIVGIRCIEADDAKSYFGYKGGVRWGRFIGKTTIKAKDDKSVRIKHQKESVNIIWNDINVHKIVLMWNKGDDKKHIFFRKFNVRRK